jgi:hypothetical protein
MNGLAQNKPDAESFSDHRRRREADSELKQFQREPPRLIAYFNLPLAQRKTQQIADQFDLLDFAMARSPRGCIGFVVEA